MNKTLLLLLLLMFCVSAACSKNPTTPPPVTTSATPAPPSAETRAAFRSPEALTKFLEQRWPISGIQTFSIPERRHNEQFENLGVEGQVWRGSLFATQDTGFDEISWYANVKNGQVAIYSLGARKGDDFWLLEIADQDDVRQPPDFAPDPKLKEFVGHK